MATRNRPAPRPAPRPAARSTERSTQSQISKSPVKTTEVTASTGRSTPVSTGRPQARPTIRSVVRTTPTKPQAASSSGSRATPTGSATRATSTRATSTRTSNTTEVTKEKDVPSSGTRATSRATSTRATPRAPEKKPSLLKDLPDDPEGVEDGPVEYEKKDYKGKDPLGELEDLEDDVTEGGDEDEVIKEQEKHLQPPEIPEDMRVGVPVRNIQVGTILSDKCTRLEDFAQESSLVKPLRPSQIIPRKSTSRLR